MQPRTDEVTRPLSARREPPALPQPSLRVPDPTSPFRSPLSRLLTTLLGLIGPSSLRRAEDSVSPAFAALWLALPPSTARLPLAWAEGPPLPRRFLCGGAGPEPAVARARLAPLPLVPMANLEFFGAQQPPATAGNGATDGAEEDPAAAFLAQQENEIAGIENDEGYGILESGDVPEALQAADGFDSGTARGLPLPCPRRPLVRAVPGPGGPAGCLLLSGGAARLAARSAAPVLPERGTAGRAVGLLGSGGPHSRLWAAGLMFNFYSASDCCASVTFVPKVRKLTLQNGMLCSESAVMYSGRQGEGALR